MECIHSALCTADQAATMMQNAWRYARVNSSHVRIRPPDSDVSVIPPGPVRYVATIEVLDAQDTTWGTADVAGVAAVQALFGAVLP